MNLFFILIAFIAVFFLAYSCFLIIFRKKAPMNGHFFQSPAFVFILLGLIGCLTVYFFTHTQNDALYPSSVWVPVSAFVSAFIGLLLLKKFPSHTAAFIILLALSLINVMLLPSGFSISDGLLPPLAERLILAFCWSLFAVLYFIMNAHDGILSTESLSIGIGLILMYIVNIQPELYGGYAFIFTALILAFHLFSNYPAKLTLNTAESRIIGFLLGWLGILATVEGNGSCVLILIMYYIFELIIGSISLLSLNKIRKNLDDNTFYSKLAASGIPPYGITNMITKINTMLILLAGFQIYAPNSYTIVLISLFLVFWVTNHLTSENSNRNLLLTGMIWSSLRKNKKNKKDSEGD